MSYDEQTRIVLCEVYQASYKWHGYSFTSSPKKVPVQSGTANTFILMVKKNIFIRWTPEWDKSQQLYFLESGTKHLSCLDHD